MASRSTHRASGAPRVQRSTHRASGVPGPRSGCGKGWVGTTPAPIDRLVDRSPDFAFDQGGVGASATLIDRRLEHVVRLAGFRGHDNQGIVRIDRYVEHRMWGREHRVHGVEGAGLEAGWAGSPDRRGARIGQGQPGADVEEPGSASMPLRVGGRATTGKRAQSVQAMPAGSPRSRPCLPGSSGSRPCRPGSSGFRPCRLTLPAVPG